MYRYFKSKADFRRGCYCEIIGNPTVEELAKDIITNKKIWGTIRIKKIDGEYFDDCYDELAIHFMHGSFYNNVSDINRHEIPFTCPKIIANAKVKKIKEDEWYTYANYIIEIDQEIIKKYFKDKQIKENQEFEQKLLEKLNRL